MINDIAWQIKERGKENTGERGSTENHEPTNRFTPIYMFKTNTAYFSVFNA